MCLSLQIKLSLADKLKFYNHTISIQQKSRKWMKSMKISLLHFQDKKQTAFYTK